jgi:hypothetical protein
MINCPRILAIIKLCILSEFLSYFWKLLEDSSMILADTQETQWRVSGVNQCKGSRAKVTLEKLDSSKQGALFTYSIKVYLQALYRLRTPGST